jgi:hypothetical protein
MFRKLWDMLHPKEEKRVFGLTDVEVRALKDLRATDEWQVFLKVLDMQSTMEGEGMLATMDATQMWLSKGRILGLRRAGFLIDEILLKETETRKTDERRRFNKQHATDHVKSATYGTPAW